MATLGNQRKLAPVNRDGQEKYTYTGMSKDAVVSMIKGEWITQISEQIEGRMSKKISQDFSRTEKRILGALSNLYDFVLKSQFLAQWETFRGLPRILEGETRIRPEANDEEMGLPAQWLQSLILHSTILSCEVSMR